MERTKESAMKAVAKRPKLFDPLMKGDKNIHELKKIGQCSGGMIRTLIWAGVAVMNEDKTIKFIKGIKKSDLPDLDEEETKPSKASKGKEVKKSKGKEKPVQKDSKVSRKPLKKELKKASKKEGVKPKGEDDFIGKK